MGERTSVVAGNDARAAHGQRVFPSTKSGTLHTSIGVGGSQASVVRAARHGLPLMLAIIGDDPRRFAPYLALYHQAVAQFGRAVLPVGVHSPGRIAESDARAREDVWPASGVMRERIGAERRWPPTSRAEFEQEIANE